MKYHHRKYKAREKEDKFELFRKNKGKIASFEKPLTVPDDVLEIVIDTEIDKADRKFVTVGELKSLLQLLFSSGNLVEYEFSKDRKRHN